MINKLALYDSIHQKVRIGNRFDGGYVVPLQALTKSNGLYSYGVGNDISFEKEYVDLMERDAYCFDHTIENFTVEPSYQSRLQYLKEGISGVKTDTCNNFLEHYKERQTQGKVLLKADVEGAEYEFLLNTDIAELSKITTGLVIEFHYLPDPKHREEFFECIGRLNQYFLLCHVHGNNYAGNFTYSEKIPNSNYFRQWSIPQVIELSFINKELVPYIKRDTRIYPCSFLDRGNDLSKPDCDLSFLNLLDI